MTESGQAGKSGKPDQPQQSAQVEPLRRPRPCPQCGKPSSRDVYPFCSKRCADIDLGHWLKQDYAIPSDEPGALHSGTDRTGDGED